jgi:ABC-2 type transport system permease protein
MIKYLLSKEFKQIFRNPFIPKLILIMPVMMMLVLPWAANQEIKNIKLNVVDNDHSPLSARMTNKIAASGYFILTGFAPSGNEALHSVEAGEADVILEIAPDFERDIYRTGTAGVMISANAVNGVKGGLGSAYLMQIIRDFTADLAADRGVSSKFEIQNSKFDFNPRLDYKVFMIPALFVMLMTLLTGFLPALNIVGEKETGTTEQLNVTPMSKSVFILAKLIPFWIIGLVVLTVCMGIAALVYGLIPSGSLATIYFSAVIYIFVVSGLGIVISNYSETMQQAMFVMFFFMLIFILMSGLFTPVSSMPPWAQAITRLNPLRYFMEMMRSIYLKGSSMSEMMPQLAALCGFAVIFNCWAVLSYRKTVR